MAKLPPIDFGLRTVTDLLHRGKREEAVVELHRLEKAGKASPALISLKLKLHSAKRGRPPFGATRLWSEIGAQNDYLRSKAMPYKDRMDALGARYMLRKTQVETAIAKYEKAKAEHDSFE